IVVGNLYGHKLLVSTGIKRVGPDDREPKLNPNDKPPGPAPDGMAWVPGGEFFMGVADIPAFADADNVHFVYVDGFWMDKTEVTNEQFAKFVATTGYDTDAEQHPEPT